MYISARSVDVCNCCFFICIFVLWCRILVTCTIHKVTIFLSGFLSSQALLPCIPWARAYSAICSSMLRVSTPSPASDFDSWAWQSELFLSAPQEIAQNILVEILDRKRLKTLKIFWTIPATEHFCHQWQIQVDSFEKQFNCFFAPANPLLGECGPFYSGIQMMWQLWALFAPASGRGRSGPELTRTCPRSRKPGPGCA